MVLQEDDFYWFQTFKCTHFITMHGVLIEVGGGTQMKSIISFHKKNTALFLVIVVTLIVASFVSLNTKLATAEEFGQLKIKEDFESMVPPAGWTIYGIRSVAQTTSVPDGERMVRSHAMKIIRTNTSFFCQLFTPLFNGKKGGGNLLTFWHKQLQNGHFAVYVTNDSKDWVLVTTYSSNMNWTYEKINLNDFIDPTTTMQVCFLTILLGTTDTVFLDEIIITGASEEHLLLN